MNNAKQLWRRQLRLQHRVTSPVDIAWLSALSAWNQAKVVVDIGSGPGHLLADMARVFPQKEYWAVDRERAFLESARRRFPGKLNTLRCDVDHLDLHGNQADFAIARLVVQHLQSLPRFFERLEKVLRPGGKLLVIDADDRSMRWYPRFPAINNTISRLSKGQARTATGRRPWTALRREAKQRDFKILWMKSLVYSSTSDKKAFYEMFANLGDLMPKAMGFSLPQKSYLNQLDQWFRRPDARAQFGMRAILMERKPV